jgi:ATP-dependent RNA helicase SUPV3L1/SUV3
LLSPLKAAPELAPTAWVEAVVNAPHEAIAVDAAGRIAFAERPLGRLARGSSLLLPEVKLAELAGVGPGARSRVLRRLLAFARDLVSELLAPLHAPALRALSAAGRGLVYQLEQGLGTALSARAGEQLAGLAADDRALFEAQGVALGRRVLYLPSLLRPRSIERRVALCGAWFEASARPVLPRPSAVSLPVQGGADERAYAAIGFPVFGARAIRADAVERAVRALASGEGTLAGLGSVLGCPAREVRRVVEAMDAAAPTM